jgi:hypothetical protein
MKVKNGKLWGCRQKAHIRARLKALLEALRRAEEKEELLA